MKVQRVSVVEQVFNDKRYQQAIIDFSLRKRNKKIQIVADKVEISTEVKDVK